MEHYFIHYHRLLIILWMQKIATIPFNRYFKIFFDACISSLATTVTQKSSLNLTVPAESYTILLLEITGKLRKVRRLNDTESYKTNL